MCVGCVDFMTTSHSPCDLASVLKMNYLSRYTVQLHGPDVL